MRTLITILAVFTALVGGIYIGANPNTPVVGGLKDIVAPDQAEISTDQVQTLIENEFYRKVSDEKLTDGSISGMVKILNDQFSHYFDPAQNKDFAQAISGSFTGVGMAVNQDKRGLTVGVTYPGSPAEKAGLKPGDVISEVNGKSIAGLSSDASVAKVKGPDGTKVTLTVASPVSRDSKKLEPERELVLTRKVIDIPVAEGKLVERGGRKIGVVALASFTETAGELVAAQVTKLKKRGATNWVLDLRGNGGGRLDQAVDVSSIFIKGGMIVATDGRARPRRVYDAVERDFITPQPLVVLVDKGSASASEITAGAIKYRDRGLIVGTRTYGKGVFQEVTELDNGGALSLTVGRYELPGKHFITKNGLAPDLTIENDPKTRPDEALDAAYEALAQFKQ